LLAETARLWMSLGNFGPDSKWHIAGVTGPDEYTALVDDNVFHVPLVVPFQVFVAAVHAGPRAMPGSVK